MFDLSVLDVPAGVPREAADDGQIPADWVDVVKPRDVDALLGVLDHLLDCGVPRLDHLVRRERHPSHEEAPYELGQGVAGALRPVLPCGVVVVAEVLSDARVDEPQPLLRGPLAVEGEGVVGLQGAAVVVDRELLVEDLAPDLVGQEAVTLLIRSG